MDDPLDQIDLADVIKHGDPGNWVSQGAKPASGDLAYSPDAPPGTTKQYDLFVDEFGEEIEVHYIRHL
ncbi:MAG: hypothetical protein ACRD36_03840, partial [Candidatus Acidiferrum sp.]